MTLLVLGALADAALARAVSAAHLATARRHACVCTVAAVTRQARPAAQTLALAAHAGPLLRSRTQHAVVSVAREVVTFTERTRDFL